jgi:hypothetical protein
MYLLEQNKKYHYLLFIISPIMGLIYGLKTKSIDYIRWTIFVFVAIYGSVLHPSHLGDGENHFRRVSENYQNLDLSKFWEGLIGILSFNPLSTTNDDVYLHFLSYFIGTVLDSPKLFFVAVGIVFSYFYSKSIVMLLSYVNWNTKYNKFYFIYFLVFFLLWRTPGDMQTVRNGTALWYIIYCVLSYNETKRKKYIFLAFLSPLIHVGQFALSFPFWFVMVSGFRNPKVYFIVFLVSVLSSNIVSQDAVVDFASQTELGASKNRAYNVDDNRAEQLKEANLKVAKVSPFYKTYQQYRIQYNVLSGLIIFVFFFLRKRGFGQLENTLFSYGLAGASFANFFSFNYAIFNRTWQIAGVFILALFVIFLSKRNLKHIPFSFFKVRVPLFLFCLAFFPFFLFLLSAFLNNTSIYVILMPLVMLFDFDMGISIRGFIGLFM